MAQYANTLLVLNLGSEMIFVVAQRLHAQNVPEDKSSIVLNEITSYLISGNLIGDMMKTTNEILSHNSLRAIIEKISQSSIMRMDESSKQKLWDLITMIFKWQMHFTKSITVLTQRHLQGIRRYLTCDVAQNQLISVQKLVEDFDKLLDKNCKNNLQEAIRNWLQPCNVKISLLLRLGLQKADGSFISNNHKEKSVRMLENVGENIYGMKEDEPPNKGNASDEEQELNNNDFYQLQMFANQILCGNSENNVRKGTAFKLKINDGQDNASLSSLSAFDNITVQIEKSNLDLENNDLTIDETEDVNLKEELLKILDKNTDDE